jgi:hypothetical protein
MSGKPIPHENVDRESATVETMHGTSALESNSYLSLLKKDGKSLRKIKENYLKHWENKDGDEARKSRTTQYMSLTNQ